MKDVLRHIHELLPSMILVAQKDLHFSSPEMILVYTKRDWYHS